MPGERLGDSSRSGEGKPRRYPVDLNSYKDGTDAMPRSDSHSSTFDATENHPSDGKGAFQDAGHDALRQQRRDTSEGSQGAAASTELDVLRQQRRDTSERGSQASVAFASETSAVFARALEAARLRRPTSERFQGSTVYDVRVLLQQRGGDSRRDPQDVASSFAEALREEHRRVWERYRGKPEVGEPPLLEDMLGKWAAQKREAQQQEPDTVARQVWAQNVLQSIKNKSEELPIWYQTHRAMEEEIQGKIQETFPGKEGQKWLNSMQSVFRAEAHWEPPSEQKKPLGKDQQRDLKAQEREENALVADKWEERVAQERRQWYERLAQRRKGVKLDAWGNDSLTREYQKLMREYEAKIPDEERYKALADWRRDISPDVWNNSNVNAMQRRWMERYEEKMPDKERYEVLADWRQNISPDVWNSSQTIAGYRTLMERYGWQPEPTAVDKWIDGLPNEGEPYDDM